MSESNVLTKLTPLIGFSAPVTVTSLSTVEPSGSIATSSKDPELIVIIGWLEALPRHLEKYVDGYRDLFPSSSILVIRSVTASFFRGTAKDLQPAHDYILSVVGNTVEEASSAKVLYHAFSNGGCTELIKLNSLFLPASTPPSSASTTALVPAVATSGVPGQLLVLDSCPGQGDIGTAITAFTIHIKNRFVRWATAAIAAVTFGMMALIGTILRRPHPLIALSNALVKDLPPSIPRLYLYSKADRLVKWTDVEAHAKKSEDAGIKVNEEVYEDTPHVGHIREGGGKRYWDAVSAAWKSATKGTTLE